MKLNFSQITVLHDKNDSPAGSPATLLSIMQGAYPEISYSTPYLPPGIRTEDALDFLTDNYARMVHRDALLVGFGRGGLLACALQQRVPVLRLSAFAINAPVRDGTVRAEMNQNFYSRVSVYSSIYPPIKGNCEWDMHSSMAYDVPWLTKEPAYYPIAYLISAYGRHADMEQEIKLIFPAYQNPDTILG
jgi:hypothetical protein